MAYQVQSGDQIRAEDINQLVRLANGRGTIHGGLGTTGQAIGLVARAVNSGATRLDPRAVALIAGQTHPVAASAHTKRAAITPQVALPSATVNLDFICFPLEQIKSGKMGLVCLSGVCWAKYDGSTGDRGAAVEGSDQLTLSDTGPAEILWMDSTNLVALVRFGGGGSGGSAAIAHSHTTENWGFVPSWFGN